MERSQRTRAPHPPNGAALRTESTDNTNVQHFCRVCACAKSGLADLPNRVAEWCEDAGCACHDDDGGGMGPE